MIFRPRNIGLAVAVFVLLAGCGQSGPLFLPEDAPPAAAGSAQAPAEADAAANAEPNVQPNAQPEVEAARKQFDDDDEDADDGR